MNKHNCPYTSLPDHAYWKRAVASPAPDELDPVVTPKFTISASDRLSTAGSCFAQHISRHMRENEYNWFNAEPGHGLLPDDVRATFNYDTFSARYGNIYTTRQLLQMLERAYGLRTAEDDIWQSAKGFIDPYRPHIQPNGFATKAEFHADRRAHYRAIRTITEQSDVFVFTLGLTEMWENKTDGMAYALCPGCGAGEHDVSRHQFRNLSVNEVVADLNAAIIFMRERNPALRVLLTVSPVPLIATFEPRHALVSTTYSKSVLRVAAQMVADADSLVEYFPSYEIITGQAARGSYYGADLREVTPAGVAHVMKVFSRSYLGLKSPENKMAALSTATAPTITTASSAIESNAMQLARLVCDEERLLED